jgi:hypothetical protein
MRCTAVAVACAALLACAPAPPPAAPVAGAGTPAPDASGGAAQATPPTAPATAAATQAPEAPAAKGRQLDLTNGCAKPMHLYYGASPGDARGQSVTVPGGATVDVPRGADGTATVWIVDDAGRGLASVSVRRRMTHIQIDPGCSRIDAF